MADKRDYSGCILEHRRPLDCDVDMPWPRRSTLKQQSRNRREWLRRGAGRISVTPSVEVIALHWGHPLVRGSAAVSINNELALTRRQRTLRIPSPCVTGTGSWLEGSSILQKPQKLGSVTRRPASVGSGVGTYMSRLIVETVAGSPGLQERGVRHVEEMQLVSAGIGADRVSDIAEISVDDAAG